MKDLLDAPVGKQITFGDSNRFFFEPDIKTDEDLVEYYKLQIEKSTLTEDVLFFIKGLISVRQITISKRYLYMQVRQRVRFFTETAGYTQEDASRHCGVSPMVISKILNNKDLSLNSILLTGYYLVPEFKQQLLKD